jgi:ABC-type multidrug transport system ATPase subunit
MLWDEIRRMVTRGKTVLLTTHYLQEADALADRVAVINQGAIIAQGTPSEIKAKTAGKRIRCITTLDLNFIRDLPGVTEAKEDREAVEIHAIEAEPVMRELLSGQDSQASGSLAQVWKKHFTTDARPGPRRSTSEIGTVILEHIRRRKHSWRPSRSNSNVSWPWWLSGVIGGPVDGGRRRSR